MLFLTQLVPLATLKLGQLVAQQLVVLLLLLVLVGVQLAVGRLGEGVERESWVRGVRVGVGMIGWGPDTLAVPQHGSHDGDGAGGRGGCATLVAVHAQAALAWHFDHPRSGAGRRGKRQVN